MAPLSSLLAASCLLLLLASASASSGDATVYAKAGQKDSTGKNACGFGNIGKWESHFAAMNSAQFGGSCGKCAQVCGARGCTVVKIIDKCPSCGHGDIDLSDAAFREATGASWSRKGVTWSYVDCEPPSTQSATTAATQTAATAAPVAPPPCALPEGSWVRCPDTGDIFKIESTQRRFASAAVYASLGSPAVADYKCVDISYCTLGAPLTEAPKEFTAFQQFVDTASKLLDSVTGAATAATATATPQVAAGRKMLTLRQRQ